MGAFHWQSAIDFGALAVALYLLLRWSREARALRLAVAIVALRVGALLAGQFDLPITSWLLDFATVVVLLALVLIFQPELRRALMRLDIAGRTRPGAARPTVAAVGAAAWALARVRCGALIVIERRDAVSELVTPGVPLNGLVSAELLAAVFQKGSPLHDGAAVIDGDLVRQAGAILPLTQRATVPAEYGTRHRAAMGLTDRSDAVVVVVSEERGAITIMSEGHIRVVESEQELVGALTVAGKGDRTAGRLRTIRAANLRLAAAALALAVLVWSLTFLFLGRSIRQQTIPLEFTNVPSGLTVAEESADTVQVWLRGSDFVFKTADLQELVVACDLASAHEGSNAIPFTAAMLDVPFGLRVEGFTPHQVRVRLTAVASSSSRH